MRDKHHLLAVLAVCILSLGLGACAHHDATATAAAEPVPGATTIGNDPYNGAATVETASGYASTIGVADPNANNGTPTGATVSSPSSATLGGSSTTTTETTVTTTDSSLTTTPSNGSMTSSSTMSDQSDTTATTSTTTTHRRMRKD